MSMGKRFYAAWGICFYFLYIIVGSASAEHCSSSLERLAYGQSAGLRNPVIERTNTSTKYEVQSRQPQQFTGEDSDTSFFRYWVADKKNSAGDIGRLEFHFVSKETDRDTSVIVVHVNDQTSHNIDLNLGRSSDGSYLDLNLLEPVFEHLYLNSQTDEGFELEIDDPDAIDALNTKLDQLIRTTAMGQIHAPRRAIPLLEPDRDERFREFVTLDPSSDSFIPFMDAQEARALIQGSKDSLESSGNANRASTGRGFQAELLNAFSKHSHFGAIFERISVSGWQLEIDIQGYDLRERLLQQNKIEEGDLFDVGPFVFRYVLKLRSAY